MGSLWTNQTYRLISHNDRNILRILRLSFYFFIHSVDAEQKLPRKIHKLVGVVIPMHAKLPYTTQRRRGTVEGLHLPFEVDGSLLFDERCSEKL